MLVTLALLTSLLAQVPTDAPPPTTAEGAVATPTPAPTSAPTPGPTPATSTLLLVLEVGGDHLPPADRASLTEAFTLAMARRLDLEVQSPRSLMDRINFAEQQQEAGCDSSACMAEIANAMGARFVVFSRVVRLGDNEVLRADVYDNGVGRSVALAAVEAGSVNELMRRLPGLVDELVKESHGDLPLRAIERPVAVAGDDAGSGLSRPALWVGGVGLGTTVVFGTLFGAGALQSARLREAGEAYAEDPQIENARTLIDTRGSLDSYTLTFGTCASGCVGVGGLVAFVIGGGLFAADAFGPEEP